MSTVAPVCHQPSSRPLSSTGPYTRQQQLARALRNPSLLGTPRSGVKDPPGHHRWIAAEAEMTKKHKTHRGAWSTHGQRRARAPGILPTLPQELLDVIITNLKPTERLAVFRCCVALRNAVLNCTPLLNQQSQQQAANKQDQQAADKQQQQQQQQQGEVKQQLRTRLFLAAGNHLIARGGEAWAPCLDAPNEVSHDNSILQGISCSEGRALLRLAAQSKHDVHLHIRSAVGLTDRSLLPWLSCVLQPWLTSPPATPSLQNVTSIWLQDLKLGNPLPDCIRRACPGLKAYTLWNVYWPWHSANAAAATQPWPQLTEIRLHSKYGIMIQLDRFINVSMLPSLARLVYDANRVSCTCISSFSKQLTSLEVDMLWWHETKLFSGPNNTGSFVMLWRLDLPGAKLDDQQFKGLLKAAPALQQLTVGALHLEENHTAMSCGLQQLRIKMSMQWRSLGKLAKLPTMSKLQRLEVNVPSSIHIDDLGLNGMILPGPSAWLDHLHVPFESFELELSSPVLTEDEVSANMQVLARLIPNTRLTICGGYMQQSTIRALGSACFPRLGFRESSWEEGIMALLWSLMPATIEVAFHDKINRNELQALCLSATRPVTVRGCGLKAVDVTLVRSLLEATGNQMVTLVRDK